MIPRDVRFIAGPKLRLSDIIAWGISKADTGADLFFGEVISIEPYEAGVLVEVVCKLRDDEGFDHLVIRKLILGKDLFSRWLPGSKVAHFVTPNRTQAVCGAKVYAAAWAAQPERCTKCLRYERMLDSLQGKTEERR